MAVQAHYEGCKAQSTAIGLRKSCGLPQLERILMAECFPILVMQACTITSGICLSAAPCQLELLAIQNRTCLLGGPLSWTPQSSWGSDLPGGWAGCPGRPPASQSC